jgi:hypothetical protein
MATKVGGRVFVFPHDVNRACPGGNTFYKFHADADAPPTRRPASRGSEPRPDPPVCVSVVPAVPALPIGFPANGSGRPRTLPSCRFDGR